MCYSACMKKVTPVPKDTYPMRINKYLAHKGIATRTGVDELISRGKVLINGKTAQLGDKVLEKDIVEVRGTHRKKLLYLAYHKPRGIVTANPQGAEKDILKNAKLPAGVFPVGRLDKDSHGLVILTNDGRVTDRLLNPKYAHEKEYVVEVDRHFTPAFLKHMSEGIRLEEGLTKPAGVKKISDATFNIILTEGKNRQLRRMTEKLGYTVRDLKRVRVQNIELGTLQPNTSREILDGELKTFLQSIGLAGETKQE